MPNENNQNPAVDSPVATPAATSAASAAAAATEAAEAATSAAMDEVDNPAAPMAPAAPTAKEPADNPADSPADTPVVDDVEAAKIDSTMERAVESINDADSILVTLSKDPTVDEMAAAIGLTLMLDKIGKHATAIYSGKTPNALEFLDPEKTFETNTNSLQDFIIALNKDKADHLRYKIEDEFVKVYITPYRTTIEEKDLQFSHGDINVDLVISLNVRDSGDLDAALAKHGRIMHDASAINISNDRPGKLGGIEWDDPRASSISEMVVKLIDKLGEEMSEEVATALMTGVVSATDRFSNDKTSPETMEVSAKLMGAGANQQLIAVNIEKKGMKADSVKEEEPTEETLDGTILNIERDEKAPTAEEASAPETAPTAEEAMAEEEQEKLSSKQQLSPEQQLDQIVSGGAVAGQPLMDELAATKPEEPVAPQPEEPAVTAEPEKSPEEILMGTVPEVATSPEVAPVAAPVEAPVETVTAPAEPVKAPVIEAPASMPEAAIPKAPAMPVEATPLFGEQQISPTNSTIDHQVVIPTTQNEAEATVASAEMPESGVYESADDMTHLEDKTVEPLANDDKPKDYGEMMEKELADSEVNQFGNGPVVATNPAFDANPASSAAPNVAATPEVQPVAEPMVTTENVELPPTEQMAAPQNIEIPTAPAPDVAGVVMPTEPSLPLVQPVAVQGDESAAAGVPAAPEGVLKEAPKEEVNPVIVQPEPIRDPASVPPVADPGAFKIPGM